MQDEMPDERTASSVYGEERLPSYTMWTSFALGARPPAYPSGLSVPGTSWMVRRPFDGGSPRGNQYFHASKECALHPVHVPKGVLGDDGVQLAAAFRETRGDSLK